MSTPTNPRGDLPPRRNPTTAPYSPAHSPEIHAMYLAWSASQQITRAEWLALPLAERGHIPPSFIHAEWHGVIPVCPITQRIGFSVAVADGAVQRFSMSVESTIRMHECLTDYLNSSQSATSSGKPSNPGSMPSEESQV